MEEIVSQLHAIDMTLTCIAVALGAICGVLISK